MQRFRLIAVAVGVLALVAAVVPSLGAGGRVVKLPKQDCGRVEYTSGLEAVFGRFPTQAAADKYRTAILRQGFQNANIIPGCDGFRVVIRGIESFDVGVELQSEARRGGLSVTLECIKGKDDFGELEVVFGHRRTRADAEQLVSRAAGAGFTGLQLEPDPCGGFEVEIKGFANRAQADDFVDEAKKAGFDTVVEKS